MDTYNPNKLTAAPKKVDISLRQLADFDATGGDRDRVDNVRDNQVLVSLSKFNRPKTFSFRYISDLLIGGTGVTISTDKDGITTISAGGYVPYVGATQDVNLGEYELKAGQIEFDTTPTGTAGAAVMRWNDTDGTIDLGLKGGNVTLQLGQEQVARVVNKTGGDLLEANYQAIRIRRVDEGGSQGQRLAVVLAQANNDANSADTLGIVTENIAVNQEGFITDSGLVRNINTTGSLQGETWVDGDILYLSGTIPGQLTNIKPAAPTHTIIMGYVVYSHINNGKIFVKVDNGYELDELHNVLITSVTNDQVLQYESSTGLWKNKTLSGINALSNGLIDGGTFLASNTVVDAGTFI